MTGRTFARIPSAVVLLALAVVLAGCFRGVATTTVAEDGSGELVMTLYVDAQVAAELSEGEEFDFSDWDAGFPESAVLSDVTDGDDIGRRAVMTFADLDELRELTVASGLAAAPGAEPTDAQFRSFDVRRDGSVFVFDAVYPEYPSQDDGTIDADTTIEVELGLPGTVFDDNADEVDGDRLIWRFDAQGPAQLEARSQTVLIAGLVDVAGTTHEQAIAWVADNGITTGFSDDTFRPGDVVTRGQMAAFLFRALDLPPGTASFDDTIGTTHEAAIAAVADADITTGFTDGTFRPGDDVTRGQMAAFLFRALAD